MKLSFTKRKRPQPTYRSYLNDQIHALYYVDPRSVQQIRHEIMRNSKSMLFRKLRKIF